ncbi:MAG TPA: type II toxin-antitoxin system HicB family antitoxin [Candidatus Paceibacterota bacterium]
MKYLAAYRKTKYGYDVHVPALPGCHSQGRTKKEAILNIKDAVKVYLQMEETEMINTKLQEIEVAVA